jgi:hypothetical protein
MNQSFLCRYGSILQEFFYLTLKWADILFYRQHTLIRIIAVRVHDFFWNYTTSNGRWKKSMYVRKIEEYAISPAYDTVTKLWNVRPALDSNKKKNPTSVRMLRR